MSPLPTDPEPVFDLQPPLYPAPSCRARLEAALHADPDASVASARVIPVGIGDAKALLRRPGGDDRTVEVPDAVAYDAGRGFDTAGRPCRLDLASPSAPAASPFLSVVTRTKGDRLANLEEALTALAGQGDGHLEVVLVANGCPAGPVERLVESLDPAFASRVEVVATPPLGRGAALNAGLDRARGRYVGFLDDDDIVTGDWVAAFRSAAAQDGEAVLRSGSVTLPVRRVSDGYDIIGDPYPEFGGPQFDLVDHLVDNRSPIFSWAVPLDAVRDHGLRFDEQLPVLEDWEFLMRCALAFPVVTTGRVTGIYYRWESGEAAVDEHGPAVWSEVRDRIHARLDAALGNTGVVLRLVDMERRLAARGEDVEKLRRQIEFARARAARPGLRRALSAVRARLGLTRS